MQRERRKRLSTGSTERIVGFMFFRDHFSSSPGKHSWDFCGHPIYYWRFKAALGSVYLQKIIVWTEIKSALRMAEKMSPRFLAVERSLEECKEPEVIRGRSIYSYIHRREWNAGQGEVEAEKLLGFKPTIMVGLPANTPLMTAKDIDRLVEAHFSTGIPIIRLGLRLHAAIYFRDTNLAYRILWPFGVRRQDVSIYPYMNQGTRLFKIPRDFSMDRQWIVDCSFESTLDIHDKDDLELAEFYMRKRLESKGGEKG